MVHPFFDELRVEGARMPNGKEFPPLFNFTREGMPRKFDFLRSKLMTCRIICATRLDATTRAFALRARAGVTEHSAG